MKNGDFQIFLNYLTIFIIPVLVGISFRLIFRKKSKAWLVSAVFALITALFGVLTLLLSSGGNESFGLLTISSASALASSLVCGVIIRLAGRKKNKM